MSFLNTLPRLAYFNFVVILKIFPIYLICFHITYVFHSKSVMLSKVNVNTKCYCFLNICFIHFDL